MKNIRVFLSENFQFLEEKFSIYLNRRVFVMTLKVDKYLPAHIGQQSSVELMNLLQVFGMIQVFR